MLYFLPPLLKGLLSLLLYTFNTIFLTVPLILASLLKFLIPAHGFVVLIDRFLIGIATVWININKFNTRLFCRIDWDIRGLDQLKEKEWYLVLSNHQSWVDILALQTALNQRVPMLKFFLKKELIWVPFLGLAWWALDFPFMKRYTRKEIEANPKLKGKDLEATRKACEKFKHTPVSVINFVEGTRFTPEKKQHQNSPYAHLLNPKAGGIAFVLGSMGEYLHQIINVTLVYPEGTPTFWQFISGAVHKIVIDFEVLPITDEIKGDFFNDPQFKTGFYSWLNELWTAKDEKIAQIKSQSRH